MLNCPSPRDSTPVNRILRKRGGGLWGNRRRRALMCLKVFYNTYIIINLSKLENFTSWSVNGDKYKVTKNKIEWYDVDRTMNCYVYNDYSDEKIVNFEHSFEIEISKIRSTEKRNRSLINLWTCRKELADYNNQLWVYVNQFDMEGNMWKLMFVQRIDGDARNRIYGSKIAFNVNQKYFIVINKTNEIHRVRVYKDKSRDFLLMDSGSQYWKNETYNFILLANGFYHSEASFDNSSGSISNFLKVDKHDFKAFLSIPYIENYHDVRKMLIKTLDEIKIDTTIIDYLFTDNILNIIKLEIMNADIIIADVTNANPNILYEIGYAEALNKKVILIVNGWENNIPSNIANHLYLVYDKEHLDVFRKQLKNWLLKIKDDVMKGVM